MAESIPACSYARNSLCRALQRRQIVLNQCARRTKKSGQNQPGRTQLINFFTINEKLSFVDLPGYGFAKVPRSMKKNWGDMIEAYLKERSSLCLVVFILDIRRDPGDDDISLRDWLLQYRLPYLYILTKSDKLSNNQAIVRRKAIEKALQVSPEGKPILFSAKTQRGKTDIWQFLANHICSLPASQSS